MNLVTCFNSNTSLRSAYKDDDGKALLTALSQQIQTELRNKKRKLLDELNVIKRLAVVAVKKKPLLLAIKHAGSDEVHSSGHGKSACRERAKGTQSHMRIIRG